MKMINNKKVKTLAALIVLILLVASAFIYFNFKKNNTINLNNPDITLTANYLSPKVNKIDKNNKDIDSSLQIFVFGDEVLDKYLQDNYYNKFLDNASSTEAMMTENKKAILDTAKTKDDIDFANEYKGYYKLDAKTGIYSDNIFTISFEESIFSGGAHGSANNYIVNYDIKNKKVLSFGNILNIAGISFEDLQVKSKQSLIQDLKNSNAIIDENLESMINDGISDKGSFEEHVYFDSNKKALIVNFPQYSVLPYVYGIREISIKVN